METTLRTINAVIGAVFICYTYQFLYIPLVLAKSPSPLPHRHGHRYAVLIAAGTRTSSPACWTVSGRDL